MKLSAILSEAAAAAAAPPTNKRSGVNPRNITYHQPGPKWFQYFFMSSWVVGAYLGYKLREVEFSRQIMFRDKSAMFRGVNPDPVNNPSWGTREVSWIFPENKIHKDEE